MKIYKKKWLLEIRRMSDIRSYTQRKRRNAGRCYYRWRNYRNAFNKSILYDDKVIYADTDSIYYIKQY